MLTLKEEQVDILGGEDELIVAARGEAEGRIKDLERAMVIAEDTRKKIMLLER